MGQRICFFLFLLIFTTSNNRLFAQEDTLGAKPTLAVLPLIYYTPETDWAFGAGAVSNFKLGKSNEKTFTSQLALGGAYTLLNQLLVYSSWRIFTDENKHLIAGEIGWYRYVYFFYGIGPEVAEESREQFDADLPRLRLDYLKKTHPNFFLGLRYAYDSYRITQTKRNGQLDKGNFIGKSGGRISGIGPLLYYDSRNSQLYPTRGIFAETGFQYFGKIIGSDFNYGRWLADFRNVQTIGKNQVLVWNAYYEGMVGDVPFFALPMMGGNKLMRGLFEGKYRDRNLLLLQGEYRWKFLPRWGVVAFSGLGNVFSESNPLQLNQTKLTYGAGGRFQLSKKEKLNFRLDLAHSPGEDFRIYLTFGEAF